MSSAKLKKTYDAFGAKYHEKISNVSKSFWNQYLDEYPTFKLLRGLVKGKKVVDLGCGSGVRTRKLAKLGAHPVGIDFSKTLIGIARKENPKLRFYRGDIRKTPFKNAEFDIAVSNLVLHYFKDLKPVLKETNRILKKGGIFIFSLHHPVQDTKKKIMIDGKREYLYTDYFHNRALTWNMLEGMDVTSYHHTFENIINSAINCGFSIEQIVETKAPTFSKKKDPAEYEKTSKYPSFLILKIKKK